MNASPPSQAFPDRPGDRAPAGPSPGVWSSRAAPQATPDRPWLGLAHFTVADREYFYGRDAEIAELTDRVRRAPLTVLFGVSGYGKSSLLGAGLIPALEGDGHRVTLLRRCYDELAERSLAEETMAAIAADWGQDPDPSRAGRAATTLWEYFHDRSRPWLRETLEAGESDDEEAPAGGARAMPVLIFDQFEEIFIKGEDRATGHPEADARARESARDFLQQLADLVENRPPVALRRQLDSGSTAEKRALLRRYDFQARPVRVAVALRDDFLSRLERWRRAMPSMMEHRIELRLLSGPQAYLAVHEPGTKRPGQPPIIPPPVAEAIVRAAAGAGPDLPLEEIDAVPPILSLLCERLNDRRLGEARSPQSIDETDFSPGEAARILGAFYEDKLRPHPQAVREYVEDKLVSDSGFRENVTLDSALASLRERGGVADAEARLRQLVDDRILVIEDRGGKPRVELTHDTLARLALQRRAEREAKQRRRRAMAWVAGSLVVGGLSLGLTVWAGIKTVEAEVSKSQFQRERDTARHNEGLAWMLRAEVAEERGNRYPDTLLYAAQAIGFEGFGRPDGAGADDPPFRFLRPEWDPKSYERAREWIASRPAYRPLWSSGNRPETPATGLAVDPTGRWLALGSAAGVRLIDLRDGGRETVIPDVGGLSDLAFSPDGKVLALATEAGVQRWLVDEARLEDVPGGAVSAIAWSPGGDQLAGAGPDGAILLWEEGAGEPETIPGAREGSPPVVSLAYSPENAFLAGVLPGAGPRVWFPDYRALASAWEELNAEEETLAKVEERDRPAFLERVGVAALATSVAVSHDGLTLAIWTQERAKKTEEGEESSANRGALVIWDVATATIVGRFSSELLDAKAVTTVANRTDGGQLATGAGDGTIKLWSVTGDGTLRLVATLTGHVGAVTRLVYGPRGGVLASAGADGSAKLWEVSGGKLESLDLFAFVNRFEERGRRAWYELSPEVGWQAGTESGFLDEEAARLALNWRGPEPTAAGLVAGAEKAAGEKRWRLVELRAQELARIGAGLPDEVAGAQAMALPKADPSLGDEFTNGEGMVLLWCPPGNFQMGSPEGEEGRSVDETRHEVTLTEGFWLGQTEVTQAQWIAVMGRNPAGYKDGLSKPVEMVNWEEAMEYCRRLTDRERARGAIPPGWEYRLPTEAQWEYACRARTETAWSFGDDKSQLHRYGNFNDATGNFFGNDPSQDDKHQYTAPVRSYAANPWGFHDMHGNVWEWCLDQFDQENQAYGDQPATDPVGTRGSLRVFRGGSFNDTAAVCRAAGRSAARPTIRFITLGLRPALVPSSQAVP